MTMRPPTEYRPLIEGISRKIADDGGPWHRMGDVGYLDSQDRFWFCGRMAHRVTTPVGALFTIPCEAVFNLHPKVRRTALVGVALKQPLIDLGAALLIAAFIGWTAFRIISKNAQVLADAAAFDPARIAAVAMRLPGVRSRGPQGHVFIDLHMQVDPSMTTEAAHALGHRVAESLKRELPGVADVLVHVEPFGADCEDRGGSP